MPTELNARSHFLDNSVSQNASVRNPSENGSVEVLGTSFNRDEFNAANPSGRLDSGGIGSLLGEIGSGGKRWACLGFGTVLREIGFVSLAHIIENGVGNLKLPGGIDAKVEFSERTFEPIDPYIMQDDIRKACGELFFRNNQEIKWVESKGTIKLEKEVEAEKALLGPISASGNAQVSSLLKYRRLELYESPCGTIQKETTIYNALQVPVTANMANQMPIGSEFELTFEGHALAKPGLSAKQNLHENAFGEVAFDGSVLFSSDKEGDVSILVQKLPRPNEVLVKISKVDGHSNSLQAKLSIFSQTKLELFSKVRAFLSGIFDKIVDRFRMLDWVKSVFNYRASIKLDRIGKKSKHDVKRYVFDLSKPHAQMAYNDIFSQFSTKKADALVSQKDKGVLSQGGGEIEGSQAYLGEADMGSTNVWLDQSVQKEREGKLRNHLDDILIFRESKFTKKYFDWFSGEKSINWESVSLKDNETKKEQRYYHLVFENKDRITEQREIDQFLNFSRILGVNIGDHKLETLKVKNMSHIFANRDDTQALVDIYFSDKGIEKIKNATHNELLSAFLTVQIQMGLIEKEMPFLQKDKEEPQKVNEQGQAYELARKYSEFQHKWIWTRWWFQKEISDLEAKYLHLTKREIVKDARALDEAEKFAQKINSLKEAGKGDDQLFSMLGKRMGFDYMRTIAAMALIAQEKETIIHRLSMSAGGISLRSADEGEIMHPEREVLSKLASLA